MNTVSAVHLVLSLLILLRAQNKRQIPSWPFGWLAGWLVNFSIVLVGHVAGWLAGPIL